MSRSHPSEAGGEPEAEPLHRAAPSNSADRAASPASRRRHLLFRLRRAAAALEQRERLQEAVLGLLFAALASLLPAAAPIGTLEVLERLRGEPVVTQGLLFPVARGFVHAFGVTPEEALLALSAVFYGLSVTLVLATLRRLGFRRTASVPATLTAFLAPVAWLGATSPGDFAAGVFGSCALLASLLELKESVSRGYQWRAILLLGLATMLRAELVLLLPAVAWAAARHPARRAEAHVTWFSVVLVVTLSIVIGLSGPDEDARALHLARSALAGADPALSALARWPLALVLGFGAALLGLHALLIERRDPLGQRAPRWLVPWCLVILAPVAVGAPEAGPSGSFLVPATALGVAEWLNRRGERRAEARAGALLVAAQLALTLAVAAGWLGALRAGLLG